MLFLLSSIYVHRYAYIQIYSSHWRSHLFIISIVQLLCHNNRAAEIYCAKYMQTILDHFPLDIGAADTFAVKFCLRSHMDRIGIIVHAYE